MIVRSPCPKCREPMLPGVRDCGHCSYRLTHYEVGRAVWKFRLKMFASAIVIGVVIMVMNSR